jgi:hypothetical protein
MQCVRRGNEREWHCAVGEESGYSKRGCQCAGVCEKV